MELVFQDSLNRGQRRIATTLPQPIHRDVQTSCATQHSSQRVRHRQVVVVMGMEVEMYIRIALLHLTEVLDDLQGIHHTQRVGQHETLNGCWLLAISC